MYVKELELTYSSVHGVSFVPNKRNLFKSSWSFTLGRYGSQYDYVIYVALIFSSRASQITTFQPPLSLSFLLEKVML